jgi:hypothetical protein
MVYYVYKLVSIWNFNWKLENQYINFDEFTVVYVNRIIKFCKDNNNRFTTIENTNSICGEFILSKMIKKYNISWIIINGYR